MATDTATHRRRLYRFGREAVVRDQAGRRARSTIRGW